VSSVSFGSNVLEPVGEQRPIKIIGTPYTPFQLTLTDIDYQSILTSSAVNSTTTDSRGKTISALNTSIPSTGVYSFNQSFPKLKNIVTTKVNGSMAASGATKIIFDDLTGVEVGDELLMNEITPGNSVKVTVLNPDTDNVNECSVSSSITAADNTSVRFVRSTSYKLNITSTKSLGSLIPTTDPTYTIGQYTNSIITLRLSKTRTDYTVSDGTTTGGASDTTFDKLYVGKANFSQTNNKSRYSGATQANNSITFTLDAVGAKTFTLAKQPAFNTYEPDSDFTNTDPLLNGGTEIDIRDIVAVLSAGDGICTITLLLDIEKWGTQDVTIDLDLDNIIS
jgi:hypothetical protein